ncbi:MAG: aminoacyl-tRNA hydrolase [Candidatus Sumerlaeia bacterium]
MPDTPPHKRLIVGLGNPGRAYRHTPHNIGWEVVDRLAGDFGLQWATSRRHEAELAEGPTDIGPLCLMKPLTFMNLSGRAVASWVRTKPIDLADILVITDDINLPLGRVRIRPGGSAGGHNGLKSLIACLGSDQFPRLRIGINPGQYIDDLTNYVLSPLPARERAWLSDVQELAAEAVRVWAVEGCRKAMNRFNGQFVAPPET